MPDDDFFIRRFARERDAGRMDPALEIWEDACMRKVDFVEGMIRKFQFPSGGRLPVQERGPALTECLVRCLQMGQNFRGTTGAEFRAAIKRAVWYGCMDVGRELMAYEEHIDGSLDKHWEDSGEGGPLDALMERYLSERADLTAEAEDADLEMQRAIDLVHWAIPQVSNDNYRTVLELTFYEKLTGEQIADRLQISLDNVYQRRSRGLKKLGEILRDYRP